MDKINEITSECFIALSQLRELDGAAIAARGGARPPERVRRRAARRGRASPGCRGATPTTSPTPSSRWPTRSRWASRSRCAATGWGGRCSCVFFNETLAGEGFFTRLTEIRRDPRRADTLRVYYQCLLFGFQGKYSIRGGDLELMRLIDSLRPEIERHIEPPDSLSPAGEPPDEPLVRAVRQQPVLCMALGVFAVAIAVFVGLRVSLSHQIADLAARVAELSALRAPC